MASETENGSQRNNCQSSHKDVFSSSSSSLLSVFSCIEFNYCVRRLSSLWVEASCLFFEEYSEAVQDAKNMWPPKAGRGCILLCDMLSYTGGRKINWQLNDTPCEDDKRHLVAQEEVGSEGLCNEGLMTIHKRFSVR